MHDSHNANVLAGPVEAIKQMVRKSLEAKDVNTAADRLEPAGVRQDSGDRGFRHLHEFYAETITLFLIPGSGGLIFLQRIWVEVEGHAWRRRTEFRTFAKASSPEMAFTVPASSSSARSLAICNCSSKMSLSGSTLSMSRSARATLLSPERHKAFSKRWSTVISIIDKCMRMPPGSRDKLAADSAHVLVPHASSFQGPRYSRPRSLLASSSPMMTSFSGSHLRGRFTMRDISARCPGVALRWAVSTGVTVG
jgi:hypothetical protein